MHIIKCIQRKENSRNEGVCAQCTKLGAFKESKIVEIKVSMCAMLSSEHACDANPNSRAMHNNNIEFSSK